MPDQRARYRAMEEQLFTYYAAGRRRLSAGGRQAIRWALTAAQLVADIDLAPTFVQAAHAEAGRAMDGPH